MKKELKVGDRVPIEGWPYSVTCEGEIFSERSQRNLIGGFSSTGYRAAILSCGGDKMKVMYHQVTAWTFLGPQPEGTVINHKNGIKTDNRAENLEYCTPKQNREHAKMTGLYRSGEACSWSRLSANDVKKIKRLLAEGISMMRLARQFGVNKKSILNIKKGKTWAGV